LSGGAAPGILGAALACVLATAEIAGPGVFLIWLPLAPGLPAVVALPLPVPPPFQLLAFSILSVLSMFGGRLWYLARPVEPEDPLLNDRAARMIGRKVVVIEAITHGEGRVRVDDGTWPARGPDTPEGAHMLVTDISGATLIVAPLPAIEG